MAPLGLVLSVLRRLAVVLPVTGAVATAAAPAEPMVDAATNTEEFLDFAGLDRPASPNHWLVAPVGNVQGLQPDTPAAELATSPERLASAWLEIVRAAPRTNVVAVSEDGLRIEVDQRSALFGFVDRISFQAVALDGERSSYMAFSRSRLGFWDVGVNKSRLTGWDEALRRALGGGASR